EFGFETRETKLNPDDPRYDRYKNAFPVLVASNGKTVTGKITEEQLRTLLISLTPPPRIYYVAKFLQALAIVMVFFGFMYGLLGDMWSDLYLFLGGILVFVIGWILEKQETHSREAVKKQ
ncbi:MAG TPA: hypothetical protein VGA55_09405, partial [Bacteroidota bacterium]